MNSAVEVLVVHGPQVAGIWLVLLILAAAALAGLAAPHGALHPHQVRAWLVGMARQRRLAIERRAAEAAEAGRYAGEIAVAAHRAAATAQRQRTHWHDAQQAVAVAWDAYQAAEAALSRAGRASGFAAPVTPRTPAEYAGRERFLHRAATAACRRGDLSIEQLGDVLANRAGWDPRLHPVEQESRLARATAEHRLAGYRAAVTAERDAWQDADLAAAALRALRQEAAGATADAGSLGRLEPATRQRTTHGLTGRPRLAAR